jgi:hypothetical protein
MLGPHETLGEKMKIQVITSFNQSYYDLIGRHSVESWLKHWPQTLSLTCYVEEMTLPSNPRITQIGFDQLGDDYRSFQETDYKNRVHIFAKKAYSVMHAMHHSTADRIMWLDADVLTVKPMSMDLLRSIMPDSVVSTHMGVHYTDTKSGLRGDWLVPETGVFVLNPRHQDFAKFRDEYCRRYQQRDFSGLRRSYDNDVYGAALRRYNVSSLDLCADLKKSYKTPLKHTILGEYLHHYKAKHSKDYFSSTADQ